MEGIQFLPLLNLHWRVPGVPELIPAVLVWRRRLHPRKSHLHLEKNKHHPPARDNLQFPISLMCMGPCLWNVRRRRRTWSGPTRAQGGHAARGGNQTHNLPSSHRATLTSQTPVLSGQRTRLFSLVTEIWITGVMSVSFSWKSVSVRCHSLVLTPKCCQKRPLLLILVLLLYQCQIEIHTPQFLISH